MVAAVVFAAAAAAQTLPNLSPEQLQQLQQLRGSTNGNSIMPGQSLPPRETVLEPMAAPNPRLPTSRLEQILSDRAGVKLKQIGYDQLGVGRSVSLPQVGAVQDRYVLGPGDEIIVTLRGQENSEYRAVVDRDGSVVLPRINPVPAAGRTLGEFRQDVVAAIRRTYVSTEGFVTVGRLRQIGVLVSGEVGSPGMRTLTGLSTPADAVLISGGIKKSGSLRSVRVIRGGKTYIVDLYSVLTGEARASSLALTDGDRVVVPPLGRTVAVAGWVRRPGIYELAAGRSTISTRDLLALAGGLEVRGKYRLSVLRVAEDGRNRLATLESNASAIGDSDILFVQPAASQTESMATLSGGTALAGKYATGAKLSDVLKSPGALGEDPYTLFGVISRRDPVTLLRVLVPFTPVAVLNGSEDMALQSDDVVRVVSTGEARTLFTAIRQIRLRRNAAEEAEINPNLEPAENPLNAATGAAAGQQLKTAPAPAADPSMLQSNAGVNSLASLLADNGQNDIRGDRDDRDRFGLPNQNGTYPFARDNSNPYGNTYSNNDLSAADRSEERDNQPVAKDIKRVGDLAKQLKVDPLVLINFLDDRAVTVDGAVQGPGIYLVGPDADIRSLLAAAGGVSRRADKSTVEVISTTVDAGTGKSSTERRTLALTDATDAAFIVSPRDQVRVNEVYTAATSGSVTVQGQVRNGGTYRIMRGEHLSDLLHRAGGLTETAYPYGTVFLRRSAAIREQESNRRQAQEIENQLVLAMSRRDPNAKLSPDAFAAMQSYIGQIRSQKALGRVVVAADPAVLAANPASDPLLEPGDLVFVPQKPYSVAVLGEVLQPGNIPYEKGMSASDYVERAGGYTRFADENETILVLPDGSAQRVDNSWLNFGSERIPPGSTIFVARDISGIDLHQIIVDTTQIFSQLAVSAASLAVLSTQVK
ncbi:SLBB domain-containing protein [Rhizomicrobium electricum]|uniref:Sugar transporter n=1 Tax=Rhizomicrobium electricum TaxID=480070 RepID=A0ABP3P927_9PROT|nr:SLBB domain-containing protein [Rhizomicrobium electricum]NIJ48100.1 protein involved in polysaccharide export with SLBB domain [Rhizomicrobium electricum]